MNLQTADRLRVINWRTIRLWVAVSLLEGYLLVAYFVLTAGHPTEEIRYLVYPFLWSNAGLWVVSQSEPSPGNRLHRSLAAGVAGAYLLTLLYLSGNVGFGATGMATDLRVEMYAPGWGPLVAVTNPLFRLYLLPFEVIGYASLAYLLYANLLDLTRGVFSGAIGLVTCVGCTVPVLAALAGVLGGPATSLTTTVYAWSYDIGTLLFLLTLGLLYWGHLRNRQRTSRQ